MPLLLNPVLQHYAWGGNHFLYDFLSVQPTEEPAAELWLGAHPKGPAKLPGPSKTLLKYIDRHPEKTLGRKSLERFGPRLPYLLKVLDVREMLSIQVHPDKQTAEAGFIREEGAGIPRSAPNRNYRDDNHKPELGVAVSDFYLLHGFRDAAAVQRTLSDIPEWQELIPVFAAGGIAGLYGYVMEAEQVTISRLLDGLALRLLAGEYDRSQPEFWARRAVEQYTDGGSCDRGIFSIYWFNLVHLEPGEGIFQAAGIPHAYLEGQCIELMADSDNVLRGGLTQKHIDVPELLSNICFDPIVPRVLSSTETVDGWFTYLTSLADFKLSYLDVSAGQLHEVCAHGPEVLLLFSGAIIIGNIEMDTSQKAIFLEDGERISITTNTVAKVFRASVGDW